MSRALTGVAALICGLTIAAASSWADTQVGSYNGLCNYRCCDQNNNCSVFHFYTGSGEGSFSAACNWESVCARQGEIGWSWSNVPLSKANSTLTYQRGCWTGWRQGDHNPFGTFYVKACAAARAMRH
jgi:hypothetical protein